MAPVTRWYTSTGFTYTRSGQITGTLAGSTDAGAFCVIDGRFTISGSTAGLTGEFVRGSCQRPYCGTSGRAQVYAASGNDVAQVCPVAKQSQMPAPAVQGPNLS